ncbi:MAG: BrnA antitoxin family protein [Alphaproteobacteria bacterium]|nr:BrnA antitoxin family protein [Alphaproteobacteria bacterium]
MKRSATRRPNPPKNHGENPPWTAADFAKARPMAKAFPQFAEALKRGPGRPKLEKRKRAISLRLDPDAVAAFQATGKGWQVRINEILVRAARKLPKSLGAKAQ